jgi:flagellar hook-basal body complex protein FliE
MVTIDSVGVGSAAEMLGPTPPAKPGGPGILNLINDLLSKVNVQQATADQGVQNLALGQTDNLHGVMLEVAKADLNFHLFLEIRNRLTDALQEVLHMQV